jgi:hypothetical protein
MKIQVLFFCFLISTSTNVFGQRDSLSIRGKSYSVLQKSKLTNDAYFYELQESKKTAAAKQYYLKTQHGIAKTSFTQSAWKLFLATGKLSSFGTIKTIKHKGKDVKVAKRGNTSILAVLKNGKINILEFTGGLENVMYRDANGNPTSVEGRKCMDECWREYEENLKLNIEMEDGRDWTLMCLYDMLDCSDGCRENFDREISGYSLHTTTGLTKITY